jgi:hypothetical protein
VTIFYTLQLLHNKLGFINYYEASDRNSYIDFCGIGRTVYASFEG